MSTQPNTIIAAAKTTARKQSKPAKAVRQAAEQASTAPTPTQFDVMFAEAALAHAEHVATCTALGPVEALERDGHIEKDGPEIRAVEAAQAEACHISAVSFCAMVDTPAPRLVDISRKLGALLDHDMLNREPTPSYDGAIDDDAVIYRVLADFTAYTGAAPGDDANIFALCREHGAAYAHYQTVEDQTDGDVSDEADLLLSTAHRAYRDIYGDLSQVQAQSFAGIAAKADLIERMAIMDGGPGEIDFHNAVGSGLVMSLLADIGRIADPVQTLVRPNAAEIHWDRLRSDYDVAKARHDRVSAISNEAGARIRAEMPDELVNHMRKDHRMCRWGGPIELREDKSLTHHHREFLEPMLVQWLAREKALETEFRIRELEADDDAADTVEWQAIKALIHAPAPSPAAMALKMRLVANFEDDERGGFDSPDFVLTQLDGSLAEVASVTLFQDALRLSGQDDGVLSITPWSAENWAERFEERGGYATIGDVNGLVLQQPTGCPDKRPSADDLMAELYAEPGRADALTRFVHSRFWSGGDPRRTADDKPKAMPCMPKAKVTSDLVAVEVQGMAAE